MASEKAAAEISKGIGYPGSNENEEIRDLAELKRGRENVIGKL